VLLRLRIANEKPFIQHPVGFFPAGVGVADTLGAANGVDGNPGTSALAAGEWPWTYEVDLLEPQSLRRLKVTFAPRGHATELRLSVSADREHWTTVAEAKELKGDPFAVDFAPVTAQWVRVSAVKPDGPDQPGRQMAVAELEVYAVAQQPTEEPRTK